MALWLRIWQQTGLHAVLHTGCATLQTKTTIHVTLLFATSTVKQIDLNQINHTTSSQDKKMLLNFETKGTNQNEVTMLKTKLCWKSFIFSSPRSSNKDLGWLESKSCDFSKPVCNFSNHFKCFLTSSWKLINMFPKSYLNFMTLNGKQNIFGELLVTATIVYPFNLRVQIWKKKLDYFLRHLFNFPWFSFIRMAIRVAFKCMLWSLLQHSPSIAQFHLVILTSWMFLTGLHKLHFQ